MLTTLQMAILSLKTAKVVSVASNFLLNCKIQGQKLQNGYGKPLKKHMIFKKNRKNAYNLTT